jgi:hypothetical protein
LAQLLEAAWDDWLVAFDGAEPGVSPLIVHVYATAADFQAQVKNPDGSAVQAGGYYDPQTQIAALYVQPSIYYTRSLALHEAAHQYHDLARLGAEVDPPTWYTEATASWLQFYDWDGVETTLGVTPLATLEDYPAQGLADLQAVADFSAWIAGEAAWTRPLGRLLFRYLHQQSPTAFASFRQDVDAGEGDTLALFQQHFGDPAAMKTALLDWAPSDAEPFDIVFVQWVHRTQSAIDAEAEPGVLSFLKAHAPLSTLSLRFSLSEVEEKAGMLLAWDSPQHYTMATVTAEGTLEVITVHAGEWEWLETLPLGQPSLISMTASGSLLSVNGEEYGPYDIGPGTPGLITWGSSLTFYDLSWTSL